jgi:hypothetical protein
MDEMVRALLRQPAQASGTKTKALTYLHVLLAGAQERSGKIKRKSTERRRKKRASKVRIGGMAGTSPAAEPRPVSLPNLESPARAASQRSSSVASHQTPEVSRSNASTASRHMPELSQSTKKRHQQAEVRRRPRCSLAACRH